MPSTEVTQMVMDANTVTTIVNNLNSLYSNAISQLITYTIGILALVGILIPIAISYFQNKQLKADNKALSDKVTIELEEAKKTIAAELLQELSKEILQLNAKIDENRKDLEENFSAKSAGLNAKSHHIQGNSQLAEAAYLGAYEDYLIAMCEYAKSKEEGNIPVIFVNMKKVLPNLNRVNFENKDHLDKLFDKAIQNIESINTNGRYRNDIQDFKEALNIAKNRAPK